MLLPLSGYSLRIKRIYQIASAYNFSNVCRLDSKCFLNANYANFR